MNELKIHVQMGMAGMGIINCVKNALLAAQIDGGITQISEPPVLQAISCSPLLRPARLHALTDIMRTQTLKVELHAMKLVLYDTGKG